VASGIGVRGTPDSAAFIGPWVGSAPGRGLGSACRSGRRGDRRPWCEKVFVENLVQ